MEVEVFNRRKKGAYDRVFSDGEASQADKDVVLQDIISKTYLRKPINGNELERAEKEGLRKLGLHISNMLNLPESYFIKLDEVAEERNKKNKVNRL